MRLDHKIVISSKQILVTVTLAELTEIAMNCHFFHFTLSTRSWGLRAKSGHCRWRRLPLMLQRCHSSPMADYGWLCWCLLRAHQLRLQLGTPSQWVRLCNGWWGSHCACVERWGVRTDYPPSYTVGVVRHCPEQWRHRHWVQVRGTRGRQGVKGWWAELTR